MFDIVLIAGQEIKEIHKGRGTSSVLTVDYITSPVFLGYLRFRNVAYESAIQCGDFLLYFHNFFLPTDV